MREPQSYPIPQPALPSLTAVNSTPHTAGRGLNIPEVLRATVADVREELAGASEPVVLAALVGRLQETLPGVTMNEDALRAYAREIRRTRRPRRHRRSRHAA